MTNARFIRHLLGSESDSQISWEDPNYKGTGKSWILNKPWAIRYYVQYMVDRTSQMFEWHGLPPTIPKTSLEWLLQSVGMVIIAKVPAGCHPRGYGPDFRYTELQKMKSDSQIYPYALYGSFGEAPDPYQAPITAVVANPGFEPSLSKTYTINKDCIIGRNDTQMLGLMPLHRRYAAEMVEATISLRSALINLREQRVFVADNDRGYESAMHYLELLEAGELGVIMDNTALAGSKVWGAEGRANAVIQAIEAVQYLKSAWFNDVGLQSAFNMKREYLSENEVVANTDLLKPLPDDMFACRQALAEDVNAMFGLNISVEKNSAWENKERESQAGVNQAEADVEATKSDSQISGGGNE